MFLAEGKKMVLQRSLQLASKMRPHPPRMEHGSDKFLKYLVEREYCSKGENREEVP